MFPLAEVKDAAFAQGALGKGVAIIPTKGIITAPVSGLVTTLFPTLHAIGITSEEGVEILIHIGLDTVQLEGKYFKATVSQGDSIKKGDLLLQFDIDSIKNEGYSIQTPIIITNTSDYLDVLEIESRSVKREDKIITIIK